MNKYLILFYFETYIQKLTTKIRFKSMILDYLENSQKISD